ncbi:MAG TPA: hypothetical protein PKA64_17060 [Myxococcota bacterium]|nr:hypothetical protein [Myxococcota bacterium]
MCKQTVLPINLPALGEKLFRSLNLRGGQNPDGVGSVVDASITALDLTAPEYAWLAREKRYIMGGEAAAVAAQNGQWEVRNNAGSGIISIVDKIVISAGASSTFGVYMSTVVNLGLGQNGRITALDGRQEEAGILSTPSPQTLLFAGTSVLAIPASALYLQLVANVEVELVGPWVLKPGTYLRTVWGTVNVAARFRAFVRERVPTPSELT